jgi:transcriptional regulator with XRE-family HTH domain
MRSPGTRPRNHRPDFGDRVGERIRRARLERGLTQAQLARLIKSEPGEISGWENGRHFPSREHLDDLEHGLHVPAEWFLREHDDPVPALPSGVSYDGI